MSVLSVLGGLLLLLLGICGVGACAYNCATPKAPAAVGPAPPMDLWQQVFPERLGPWTRRQPLLRQFDGAMTCTYARGEEECQLRLKATAGAAWMQSFGEDIPGIEAPAGWRFLRLSQGPDQFIAGFGEAWTRDQGVWEAHGAALRILAKAPSPQAAAELLQELPQDRLRAALRIP